MSTTTMCEFCGELTADKNRHKLVDWRGRSTVIGAVLESFLKIQCASGLPPVCGKCRRSILELQKLHEEFVALKESLEKRMVVAKARIMSI